MRILLIMIIILIGINMVEIVYHLLFVKLKIPYTVAEEAYNIIQEVS